MMPSVLMFCGQFYPVIGGAERQAEKLSRALLNKGCRVEVLTPRLEPEWPPHEVISGLTVHRFSYRNLTRGMTFGRGLGVPNTLYLGRQVRRAVARHMAGFDVLHAHIASPMSAYAAEAARALGKKTICKIACGGAGFDFIAIRKTSLLGPRMIKKTVASTDRLVAISGEVKMDMIAAAVPAEKIVCIPNGVEMPVFYRGATGETARNFLYLGRFTNNPRRDFRTLLLAFDALAASHPECQLRLVGGGERELEIKEILAALPFARERTEIIGYSDPRPWLEWADVLVQPSFSEGMSNTLLEAMANGLACIANDIPPNREVLDDGRVGILVPLENVEALLAAMLRCVDIPGERARIGGLARTHVEAVYSMGRVTDRYLYLYRELMGKRSDSPHCQ